MVIIVGIIMNGISTRFVRASLCVLIVGGANFCMVAKPKVQAKPVKVPVAQKTEVLDVSQQLIQEVAKGDNCSLEKVKELIKAGADVNAQDEKYGFTALMVASYFSNSEVVKELLRVSPNSVNIKAKNGSTALLCALHQSVFISGQETSNIMETVKALVQAGADVSIENAAGDTPLIFGCVSPVIMRYLIDNKANVNAQNKYGKTVLIHGGYKVLNIIRFLNHPKHAFFSKPENQEAKNRLLKQVQDNALEIIAILINAGADITLKDNNGVDALMLAKECGVQEFTWALQSSGGGFFGPLYSSIAWAKAKLGFNKKN